jgi:hypothetical protein
MQLRLAAPIGILCTIAFYLHYMMLSMHFYRNIMMYCCAVIRLPEYHPADFSLQPHFFIERCGSVGGRYDLKTSLAGDAGVERIGSKSQALQVTVRP